MSVLRSEVKSRVRVTLRDRDPADFAFSSPEVHRAIERRMRHLAGIAMLGREWTTMSVTTASDVHALPGTQRYTQVLEIWRQVDGEPVEVVSRQRFAELRIGSVPGTASRGRPSWVTLIEEPDQELQGRFHPWPDATYTLDLLRSTLPAVLASDDDVIPFDEQMSEALVLDVCADLLSSATEDQRQKLKLDTDVRDRWEGVVGSLVAAHRQRHHSLRAVGRVRRSRRA